MVKKRSPLCKTCRHYVSNILRRGCVNPKVIDEWECSFGEDFTYIPVVFERHKVCIGRKCGWEGKLWEPRDGGPK